MSDTDTVFTEAMPLADTAGGGVTMIDWANLLPIGLALLILFVAFGFLMWKRPEKFTMIRINLLWLSTLVAILTLVFGHQLIKLLGDNSTGDTKTVEIVLSSLVGCWYRWSHSYCRSISPRFRRKIHESQPTR